MLCARTWRDELKAEKVLCWCAASPELLLRSGRQSNGGKYLHCHLAWLLRFVPPLSPPSAPPQVWNLLSLHRTQRKTRVKLWWVAPAIFYTHDLNAVMMELPHLHVFPQIIINNVYKLWEITTGVYFCSTTKEVVVFSVSWQRYHQNFIPWMNYIVTALGLFCWFDLLSLNAASNWQWCLSEVAP